MMLRPFFILLISVFFLSFFPGNELPRTYFKITENSTLKIEGTTNINSFSCKCNEQFNTQNFILFNNENRFTYSFDDTQLKLKIDNLDCGNNLMNKDLQKALNSKQYPFIEIKLLEAQEDNCNPLSELKDWVKLKALTSITLNGNTNKYWLDITAKKFSKNKFRFIGSKYLKMTDFCVEPPTAMLGMVKVNDKIKIDLDLEIVVN